MIFKHEALVNAIVWFEGMEARITKVGSSQIRLVQVDGCNRIINIRKGWNFRLKLSDTPVSEFRLKKEVIALGMQNNMLHNQVDYWKEQSFQRQKEITELKTKPEFPFWIKVKYNSRTCTRERLLQVIGLVSPFASIIHMDYGYNDSEKYPYYYTVKSSSCGLKRTRLYEVLEGIKEIADSIHIEYGRY